MQIQISWLLQKRTDLDLHCLQRQGISGFSRTRVKNCCTVVFSAEGEVDFEVLHVLAFDSTRKRMSVIVRHPLTKEIILYTKGADSAILSVLAKKYKGKHSLRTRLFFFFSALKV